MPFRQPNSLARTLHQVLNQVLRGQTVTLQFASEADARYVLSVLREVAAERQVSVVTTSTGPRTIELRLGAEAA